MAHRWKPDLINLDFPGVFRHVYAKKRRQLRSQAEINGLRFFIRRGPFRTKRRRSRWVYQAAMQLGSLIERPLSLYGGFDHVQIDSFFADRDTGQAFFRVRDELQLKYLAAEVLQLPDVVRGLTSRYCASRNDAMAVFLARLAAPSRLVDLKHRLALNWSIGKLSSIINAVAMYLYRRFKRIIRLDLRWFGLARCQAYAAAMVAKGSILQTLIGFFDGVTYEICRPTARVQRCMYSGHKKQHCYREQALILANGLIVSMFGPYKGASNDQELLNWSRILPVLDQVVPPNYLFYGDKGYTVTANTPRLAVPFKGVAAQAGQGQFFNTRMSKLRVTVEWPFGAKGFGIKSEYAFFQQRKVAAVSPIWLYWACSTFLLNVMTCLEGRDHNQVARYYGLDPPTIDEYMQGL